MAIEVLNDRESLQPRRLMLASPTGSGKSYIAIEAQRQASQGYDGLPAREVPIFSPKPDILDGIAAKIGLKRENYSSETKWERAREAHGLWTPVRWLNAWDTGERQGERPAACIVDEGHHGIAETWSRLLETFHRVVALTATPFRGTPKGTRELRKQFGDPVVLLTLREAQRQKLVSVPQFDICPLVNDDLLDVQGDDFSASSLDAEVGKKLDAICKDVAVRWSPGAAAAVLVVPSVKLAAAAESMLTTQNTPCCKVLGDTPPAMRQVYFKACIDRTAILVTVGVLSEGVDLPIDRLFCARPMRSPVAAMQLWGRATRPNLTPRIIDYSRNFERFAYLWDGLMPSAAVAGIQNAFGGPSARAGGKALEIEAVRRFKPLPVPLADGTWGTGYMLFASNGEQRGEWGVLFAPTRAEPVVGYRRHNRAEWERVPPDELPVDLAGYETSPKTYAMTEKQSKWWAQSAVGVGLDGTQKPKARVFAFLPMLKQSYQNVR